MNYNLGFAEVAKYIIIGPPSTPCLHQPVDLMDLTVNMAKWTRAAQAPAGRRDRRDPAALVGPVRATSRRKNIAAWDKYKAKGVQIIRLSDADIQKFRRHAIPMWFKWAKKDPLAKEAFASQLAFMKTINVGYITDSMLVDLDGKTAHSLVAWLYPLL